MTLEEAVQDLKNVKVYSFILKQILAFFIRYKNGTNYFDVFLLLISCIKLVITLKAPQKLNPEGV
jgi:hypothetical protein